MSYKAIKPSNFPQQRWILNQRAYLKPFGGCMTVYHLPIVFAAIWSIAFEFTNTCAAGRELKGWLLGAAIGHFLAVSLSVGSTCVTLLSRVYTEDRKEPYIITALFFVYVFNLGTFIFGASLQPVFDNLDILSWAIYGATIDSDIGGDCSEAEERSIWFISHLILYDLVCGTLNLLFWMAFTNICGTDFHHSNEVFQQRWTKRVSCIYSALTCRSSKPHEEAFATIGGLLEELLTSRRGDGSFETVEFSDITFCLSLVRKAQKLERECLKASQEYQPERSMQVSPALLERVAYFGKLSVGVYGWTWFILLNPSKICSIFNCASPSVPDQIIKNDTRFRSNRAAMLRHTGIRDRDLVYMNCHNDMFCTPYAIVRNEEQKEMIVTIRGSNSIEDFLTDAVANTVLMHPDETLAPTSVYTHEGILKTTRALFEHLQKGTRKRLFWGFLKANPDWKVVVCGHSLGGAVASVLTLKLQTEFTNVHGYAYAPPPIFNDEIAEWSRCCLTTIVYGDDIVSRLSLTSLAKLRHEMLEQFCHVSDRPLFQVWQKYPAEGNSDARIPLRSNSTIADDVELLKQRFHPAEEHYHEMSLAGGIIHVEPQGKPRTVNCISLRGKMDMICRHKSKGDFKRILINYRSLLDHMPKYYDRILRRCAEVAKKEHEEFYEHAVSPYIPVSPGDSRTSLTDSSDRYTPYQILQHTESHSQLLHRLDSVNISNP